MMMRYILLMIVVLLVAGCGDGPPVTGMVTYMPQSHTVIVNETGFYPEVIEIAVDDSIDWVVQSGEHKIVDIGGSYASDSLGPGQEYSVAFPEAGSYYYQDRNYRFFGEVRVE